MTVWLLSPLNNDRIRVYGSVHLHPAHVCNSGDTNIRHVLVLSFLSTSLPKQPPAAYWEQQEC